MANTAALSEGLELAERLCTEVEMCRKKSNVKREKGER